MTKRRRHEFIHMVPLAQTTTLSIAAAPIDKRSRYELRPLHIKPKHLRSLRRVPPAMRPIVDAANAGEDISPVLQRMMALYGFSTFMYGIALAPQRGIAGRRYVYTTVPQEWVQRYEARDYIEVDPRVQLTIESSLPIIWDQGTFRGRSTKVNAFLDDALAHGIGSGICLGMRDPRAAMNVFAFNSPDARNSPLRLRAIDRHLPELTTFCFYFHELFLNNILDTGSDIPSEREGTPLSPRELDCLRMMISGMRNKELADTLDITARTVQIYTDSIREKLGAVTREQAVAKAIKLGLIAA